MKAIDFRLIGTGPDFFVGGYNEMPSFMDRYKQLYDMRRLCELPLEKLLSSMQGAGVVRAVLQAEYSYGDFEQLNRRVAAVVKQYPDLLVGFAGMDPMASDDPAADLDRYVSTMGLKGLNLQPWVQTIDCSDRRFYPLYDYCQSRGLPVTLHSSINFSIDKRMDHSHPRHLDAVACDFPGLTIIANHGGWPWVSEMVAVAWKHTGVFLEIGAVSPRYMISNGSGWEPFLTYGRSLLQDQILFATDSMLDHARVIPEIDLLPFSDTVKEKLAHGNASRILAAIPEQP